MNVFLLYYDNCAITLVSKSHHLVTHTAFLVGDHNPGNYFQESAKRFSEQQTKIGTTSETLTDFCDQFIMTDANWLEIYTSHGVTFPSHGVTLPSGAQPSNSTHQLKNSICRRKTVHFVDPLQRICSLSWQRVRFRVIVMRANSWIPTCLNSASSTLVHLAFRKIPFCISTSSQE